MSLNLNAALSSFIAASLRIIHHSKTLHWKKKKKLPLTCLATKTLSVCEPSILIVVVVARAGLFTVRQIREWATYVFIYLFLLCATSSPPFVTSVAPSSVLRWRRLWIESTTNYHQVVVLCNSSGSGHVSKYANLIGWTVVLVWAIK